ncbi:MAG: hypothetical protein HZC23_01560 [Rhodocyclales bacterium]|nr:hypothetical protein [Rhodocyclales bacterium]
MVYLNRAIPSERAEGEHPQAILEDFGLYLGLPWAKLGETEFSFKLEDGRTVNDTVPL